MRAAKDGKPLRLTIEEVRKLSLDDAIATVAYLDDNELQQLN